jgi:hypothetical protein
MVLIWSCKKLDARTRLAKWASSVVSGGLWVIPSTGVAIVKLHKGLANDNDVLLTGVFPLVGWFTFVRSMDLNDSSENL